MQLILVQRFSGDNSKEPTVDMVSTPFQGHKVYQWKEWDNFASICIGEMSTSIGTVTSNIIGQLVLQHTPFHKNCRKYYTTSILYNYHLIHLLQ